MFIIAKINKWGDLVLLDGTVHYDAEAAALYLASEIPRIGEAVAADYHVYALARQP